MKNLLIIFCISICPFFNSKLEKQEHKRMLDKFFSIVADANFKKKEDQIEAFIIPISGNKGDVIKRKEFLHHQIFYLHKDLQNKSISNFTYISYKQLPKQEQNILTDGIVDKDICVIKYNGQYFMTILLEKGLIKSFTLMNKGQHKVFLYF